ncbi:MAG: ATP-binding protein [Ignavibacteriae bacterium]|nr:ATP-binding protein [Ignavibacteriota bacterium]
MYGARRVGKTTLLKDFLSHSKLKYRIDSGDNIRLQHVFESQDFEALSDYVEGYELIAIDEAQQIRNIGMGLKILVDQHPSLKIIVTGSSSFDLSQSVGEPLTGRKKTVVLYPMSLLELGALYNKQELSEQLENFLRFGLYPEIITTKSKKGKMEILRELVDSYLLKDILSLEKIKGSRQLLDLLKLLAFQIGNEVSFTELATQVRLDVKTVARYLDILEKGFVIQRIGALSRNPRKEVTSKAKYYFFDVGIRNAIISQFNEIGDRNDTGNLFENFIVMERQKTNAYKQRISQTYFWRTYDGQEVDVIEEQNGRIHGYEVKSSPGKKSRTPSSWKTTYPDALLTLINRENYLPFILDEKRREKQLREDIPQIRGNERVEVPVYCPP